MGTKRMALLCLVAAFAAANLGAQSSNTYSSTAGMFKTDTDRFQSVLDWSLIQKNLFVLGTGSVSTLSTGSGWKLSPQLFVGAWYSGNVLSHPSSLTTPEETITVTSTPVVNNSVVVGNSVTTTTTVGADVTSSINTADLLLGWQTMGFRIGVDQSGLSGSSSLATATAGKFRVDLLTAPDTTTTWAGVLSPASSSGDPSLGGSDSTTTVFAADGTTKTSNTATTYSGGIKNAAMITPHLNWGMLLKLGALTLKPQLSASVFLISDNLTQSYETSVQALGSGYPDFGSISEAQSATTIDVNRKSDSTQINGSANLDLELPAAQDLWTLGMGYSATLPSYSNAYTDTAGAAATAKGPVSDYHKVGYAYDLANSTTTDLRQYESDIYSFNLTQTAGAHADYLAHFSDQLSLKASLSSFVGLVASTYVDSGSVVSAVAYVDNSNSALSYTETITKTFSGKTYAFSDVTAGGTLRGGLQYDVVKDVLKFNLGGSFGLPTWEYSTLAVTQPGVTTVTDLKVMGDGSTATQTTAFNLGRSESQTGVASWTGLTTSVSAGFNFSFGSGVTLDLTCSTSGTSIQAATVNLQLQISK